MAARSSRAFDNGVIFDIDALKTGWGISTGVTGVAPEYQWNPSISLSRSLRLTRRRVDARTAIPMVSPGATQLLGSKHQPQALIRVLKALFLRCVNREGTKLPMIKFDGLQNNSGEERLITPQSSSSLNGLTAQKHSREKLQLTCGCGSREGSTRKRAEPAEDDEF